MTVNLDPKPTSTGPATDPTRLPAEVADPTAVERFQSALAQPGLQLA